MTPERRFGIFFSGSLNTLLLLLLIFGLPEFLTPPRPIEPLVMSVDILPISAMTNVKPNPKPIEKKQAPEKKAEAPKPVPEATPPKPKPTIIKEPLPTPVITPKEVEKPKEKEPEKKKEPEKEPEKEEMISSIVNAAIDQAKKEKAEKPDKKPKESTSENTVQSFAPNYDPNLPLSLSVRDAIRSQLIQCWGLDAGQKDAHSYLVEIELAYARDASLVKAEYTAKTKARMASDIRYRRAAESAMLAVKKPSCNPLKGLPADKFEAWTYMKFVFDPKYLY